MRGRLGPRATLAEKNGNVACRYAVLAKYLDNSHGDEGRVRDALIEGQSHPIARCGGHLQRWKIQRSCQGILHGAHGVTERFERRDAAGYDRITFHVDHDPRSGSITQFVKHSFSDLACASGRDWLVKFFTMSP